LEKQSENDVMHPFLEAPLRLVLKKVNGEPPHSVFFFSSRGLGADPLGPLEILTRKGDTIDQIRHVPLLRKKIVVAYSASSPGNPLDIERNLILYILIK